MTRNGSATPGVPSPANIVCGKWVDGDSGTTLLTIPAGRVWKGKITLNVTGSVGASGSALNSKATIQVIGAGTPTPATTQVLLSVGVSVPAQAAGTTGAASNRDEQEVILYADAANPLTVTVTKNSVSGCSASAFGQLIA